MKRIGNTLTILVASLAVTAACGGLDEPTTDDPSNPGGDGTAGGTDTTFDHQNDGVDPFEIINRLAQIGPPRFTSRVHSCPKPTYRNLGNILTSVGINKTNATALSAGQLYTSGDNALGAPSFANRIRENINITTSGASREFDIFVAGADEVIAALPTLARCQVNSVGPQLFDASNACQASGITCLIGMPATAAHVEFCNITIQSAPDALTGKRVAVAAMLAAAYTCN
ncbi:MAG: hypothetical protein ABI867_22665 [Kofleriaceae bacterium]